MPKVNDVQETDLTIMSAGLCKPHYKSRISSFASLLAHKNQQLMCWSNKVIIKQGPKIGATHYLGSYYIELWYLCIHLEIFKCLNQKMKRFSKSSNDGVSLPKVALNFDWVEKDAKSPQCRIDRYLYLSGSDQSLMFPTIIDTNTPQD